MEIETHSHPFDVFEPISSPLIKMEQLLKDSILCQMDVALTPGTEPTYCLFLTPRQLFLSIKNKNNLNHIENSIYKVEISFELKFQILYQVGSQPKSKKVGITLFKNNQQCNSLYSPSHHELGRMRDHLNAHINQRGFHSQFKPICKLGKGNFATVYEVVRREDDAKFAVKAFSKVNTFSTENGKESLINQLKVMRQISHKCPNLLSLEAIYQSDNSIYVVMELIKGKTLYEVIKDRNGKFNLHEVKTIMAGLLKGLACLEHSRIMHRDLKPENIMFRNNGYPQLQPVIVDFGLATKCDQTPYLFYRCGTPGFVAPEIVKLTQNSKYEPSCDIFSLGCIFHILMTNQPIFPGSRYEEVYKKNKNLAFQMKETVINQFHVHAMGLLRNMLCEKPQIRIKASAALLHQFFQISPFSKIKKQLEEVSDCTTSISSG